MILHRRLMLTSYQSIRAAGPSSTIAQPDGADLNFALSAAALVGCPGAHLLGGGGQGDDCGNAFDTGKDAGPNRGRRSFFRRPSSPSRHSQHSRSPRRGRGLGNRSYLHSIAVREIAAQFCRFGLGTITTPLRSNGPILTEPITALERGVSTVTTLSRQDQDNGALISLVAWFPPRLRRTRLIRACSRVTPKASA